MPPRENNAGVLRPPHQCSRADSRLLSGISYWPLLRPIPLCDGCHHARHHGPNPCFRVCERWAQRIPNWFLELRGEGGRRKGWESAKERRQTLTAKHMEERRTEAQRHIDKKTRIQSNRLTGSFPLNGWMDGDLICTVCCTLYCMLYAVRCTCNGISTGPVHESEPSSHCPAT